MTRLARSVTALILAAPGLITGCISERALYPAITDFPAAQPTVQDEAARERIREALGAAEQPD